METKQSTALIACKYWLQDSHGNSLLGEGKLELLKAIDKTGSFKAAVEMLGLSYRKTWDNLKKIEDRLGFPLVNTNRGGASGGSSELSEQALQLIQLLDAISTDIHDMLLSLNHKYSEKLRFTQKI